MSALAAGWSWSPEGVWVIAGLVLLSATTAWASWAAWRRLGRRHTARWFGVVMLNFVAAASLAALLAPPVHSRAADAGAWLLTEGAEPDETGGAAMLFAAPDVTSIGSAPGVERLAHVGQLPLRRPELGALHVAGYGLDERLWRNLPDELHVQFAPPALEGVTAASWPRRLDIGETLVVHGRFDSPDGDAVATVRLHDPSGQVVAEASTRAGAVFTLAARPRSRGMFIYRLTLETRQGDTEDAPVPVEVVSGEPPFVGVMQSAPSFETRQLQNWAGAHDARLLVLTRISRDRDIAQGVNIERRAPLELSPGLLADMDLLILDGRSVLDMDERRRRWIDEAVRGGLGLLVLADGALAESMAVSPVGRGWLDGFGLEAAATPADSVVPSFPGLFNDIALPVLGPRLAAPGARALVRDQEGRALEAWRPHGLGRVALSVLRERHRWQTSGNPDAYTAYWAHLMRHLGRPRSEPALLAPAQDALPSVRWKERICALTDGRDLQVTWSPVDGPGNVGTPASELPLVAAGIGGLERCADTWFALDGWHRLVLKDSATGDVLDVAHRYLFGQDDWVNVRRQSRVTATLDRAGRLPALEGVGEPRIARAPLAPLGPWWVFVLCASLLWLERKLDDEGGSPQSTTDSSRGV